MPSRWAQLRSIRSSIPVVQPAVGRNVASIVVIITSRTRAQPCPCSIVGLFRYSRAISIHRRTQVLRKPALVANLNHGVVVAIHRRRIARRSQRRAASVVNVGTRVKFSVGRVGTSLHLRVIGIPKTPDREADPRIAVEPVDVWIVVDQEPAPSIAATGRRTPPVADVPGIVEEAIGA